MLLLPTLHSSPAEWRGDKARIKPLIQAANHGEEASDGRGQVR